MVKKLVRSFTRRQAGHRVRVKSHLRRCNYSDTPLSFKPTGSKSILYHKGKAERAHDELNNIEYQLEFAKQMGDEDAIQALEHRLGIVSKNVEKRFGSEEEETKKVSGIDAARQRQMKQDAEIQRLRDIARTQKVGRF